MFTRSYLRIAGEDWLEAGPRDYPVHIPQGSRKLSLILQLIDGSDKPVDVSKVDVSMDGIELQDREFISAIQEHREPKSSIEQVLPAMRTLDRLEKTLK